jgi:hypothetical protein
MPHACKCQLKQKLCYLIQKREKPVEHLPLALACNLNYRGLGVGDGTGGAVVVG